MSDHAIVERTRGYDDFAAQAEIAAMDAGLGGIAAKLETLGRAMEEPRTDGTVRTRTQGGVNILATVREIIAPLTLPEYRLHRKEIASNNSIGLDVLNALYRETVKARQVAEAEARTAAREADSKRGAVLIFQEVEPWPEPSALADLLDEIVRQIRRFVVASEAALVAAALYVVFTYIYGGSAVCPILAVLSPVKGSGKSRLLAVLRQLIAHALATSNISPAALYRAIAFYEPLTMIIDEIDLVFGKASKSERAEELRNVLNAGHTRGTALVIRCDADNLEPKAYSTFCPKIVAGLGSLPETVTDRSVVVRMARRRVDEAVEVFSEVDPPPELRVLRAKLARWALDEGGTALMEPPERPRGLRDRQFDNWRPLLQLAALAGAEWTTRAVSAAAELSIENDEADDPKLAVLHDLVPIFANADPAHGILTRDIVARLKSAEGRDYSWMTEKKLGRNLSGFGVRSTTLHLPGVPAAKGYRTTEIRALFDRYFPPANICTPLGEPVRTVQSVLPFSEAPLPSCPTCADFPCPDRRPDTTACSDWRSR